MSKSNQEYRIEKFNKYTKKFDSIINDNTGNLSIENVKIAAASDSESIALKSYGIYNTSNLIINNGEITSETTAIANNGTLTLNDGKVT